MYVYDCFVDDRLNAGETKFQLIDQDGCALDRSVPARRSLSQMLLLSVDT